MPTVTPNWSELFTIDNFKSNYWIFVFLAYVILLAAAVSRHEPWMDEAQAWLLTKDLTIPELLVKNLRYEGHPPLWYLILKIPAKLGFPYITINVLSAFFSALGVWLFLRYSPFPAVIKILFPFSYFIFYQYGVVARSYCLIPPLLFSIAIIYERKMERPLLYSLLLCLLANVSAFTFLMSAAFLFVHLLDVAGQWKRLDKHAKVFQGAAVLIFGLTCCFIVLVLAPPSDLSNAQETNLSVINFLDVLRRRLVGAFVTVEANKTTWQIWLQSVLSLAIFIITFLWLRCRKLTLLYLLPLLLILGFFAVKYSNIWHVSVLFFLWIFVLWISFEKEEDKESSILKRTVLVSTAIVLAVQVYWSAYAVHYDYYHNYSGSYDAAQYIKENRLENKKIFVSGKKAIDILPYFENNIFYNHNNGSKQSFWLWSTRNQVPIGAGPEVISRIQREQPDVVIFAADNWEQNMELSGNIEFEGYRLVEIFEGNLWWKTRIYLPNTFWVYRKAE